MQDLTKRLTELKDEFLKVYEKLGISEKLGKVAELEKEVAEPEIWRDVKLATEKNQELARLNEEVQPWELLKTQIEDLEELLAMSDESLKGEFTEQISAMEGGFTELKKALRLQGAYDAKNAIMRITSGAGGTEAMD
jgi:peptide chain release factor 2